MCGVKWRRSGYHFIKRFYIKRGSVKEKIIVKEYLDKTNGNLGLASDLIKEDLIFYLQKCENFDDEVELDFSNVTLSSNLIDGITFNIDRYFGFDYIVKYLKINGSNKIWNIMIRESFEYRFMKGSK